MIWCVAAIALILTPESWHATAPGGFAAEATLSTSKLTLTDQVKVSLTVTKPKGYAIDPATLQQHLLGEGEISENAFTLVSQHIENDADKTTLNYVLEPLQAGEHYLTFRNITFKPADPALLPVTLLSGIFTVDVTSADLHIPLQVLGVLPLEAKPILDLDTFNQRYLLQQAQTESQHNRQALLERAFPWHYIVLYPVILVLLFGCWRMVHAAWAILRKPKPPPTRTETAMANLHKLETSDLIAKGDFNAFYVELTAALRQYLEGHYGMRATELTTEEFMQQLAKDSTFEDATRQQLIALLTYADRVKFAREPSTPENCGTAIAYTRNLIKDSDKGGERNQIDQRNLRDEEGMA